MKSHQNLIAGEWIGSQMFANTNPSNTNDVIGEYASASAADAEQAIAAANEAAFGWARLGLLERHAVLKKTADEIVSRCVV